MPMSQNFKYIIVGAGMMGSAVARHLSKETEGVALIGSPEPPDRSKHSGVFGSHYDESRIVRSLDTDPRWGLMAARSISRFREIEKESGIEFYYATGHLALSSESNAPENYCNRVDEVAKDVPADYERFDDKAIRARFPYLDPPPDLQGRYQSSIGGYINPRSLVRAQKKIAESQGVQMIPALVEKLSTNSAGMTAETEAGKEYRAEKVLVAAGAFCNRVGLLPRPLPLTCMGRTVLFLELGEQDVERLEEMPSLIYRPATRDTRSYLIPPFRYPDGKWYMKIGSSLAQEDPLSEVDDVAAWYRGRGNGKVAGILEETVANLFPRIEPLGRKTETCVNCYADGTLPYICPVPDCHNLFILAGMNGGTAKSSDEYGRIAAQMLLCNRWNYDVPAEQFSVDGR